MLLDKHTVPTTARASFDDTIGRSRALAILADVLLVPLELCRATVVKVAKGYLDLDFGVGAAPLARLVSVVAATPEETAEYIKGVMLLKPSTLLPLLDAFMSVLIVDLAGLGVGKGFVGLGYFNKLVFG